jgi:hypothetical protein
VIPAALMRRGRRTAIVCKPGLTWRDLRLELADVLRPAELALIRRQIVEPSSGTGALPARLEQVILQDGNLWIFHRDDTPQTVAARVGLQGVR